MQVGILYLKEMGQCWPLHWPDHDNRSVEQADARKLCDCSHTWYWTKLLSLAIGRLMLLSFACCEHDDTNTVVDGSLVLDNTGINYHAWSPRHGYGFVVASEDVHHLLHVTFFEHGWNECWDWRCATQELTCTSHRHVHTNVNDSSRNAYMDISWCCLELKVSIFPTS